MGNVKSKKQLSGFEIYSFENESSQKTEKAVEQSVPRGKLSQSLHLYPIKF